MSGGELASVPNLGLVPGWLSSMRRARCLAERGQSPDISYIRLFYLRNRETERLWHCSCLCALHEELAGRSIQHATLLEGCLMERIMLHDILTELAVLAVIMFLWLQ